MRSESPWGRDGLHGSTQCGCPFSPGWRLHPPCRAVVSAPVHFMCQLGRAMGYPDTWSYIVLDVSSRVSWMRLTLKLVHFALARCLSWLEHRPVHRKVVVSVPSQDTYLGHMFDPLSGCVREATDQCFSLTSMFLSLSPSLSLENQRTYIPR